MRLFLSIIFPIQFILSLGAFSEAFNHASLAKASPVPALLALGGLVLVFIAAFGLMFGGVSQAPAEGKLPEPVPDNAHGGWWNLGRFDMLAITVLLAGICSYGTAYGEICFYMTPDSFLRPKVTLDALPAAIFTNIGYWLAAFAACFLLCLFVRLCRRGKPGSVAISVVLALVATFAQFFLAAALNTLAPTVGFTSLGGIFVWVCFFCFYKATRCVSLRSLLPAWAGGWHEGGLAAAPKDETTPAAQPGAAPALPAVPQAAAVPPRASGKRVRYTVLTLLAVVAGIIMANWSHGALPYFHRDEALLYGILFGISFIFFGGFIFDALKKACREYRAERAEKALPYAVLALLALGAWYLLFLGLYHLID